MFAAERWARAFMAACADKKEEGLAVFKAFADYVPRMRIGAGNPAARRLEAGLKAGLGQPLEGGSLAACRTALLLVRKGLARHIPAVAREAEKIWETENRIFTVCVESAFPLEAAFTDALRAKIREKTAAREVRLDTRVMPDLIGGCRLRLGTRRFDASLRGQLHKMAADLRAAGGWAW
jgi:F-type H+-transporting ATPase subunit delta